MTIFDLFVLAIVGASVVSGALRGLVRALIASLGLAVGFVAASYAYEPSGELLRKLGVVESVEAAHACGFLLVVGVVLLLGFVLGASARAGLRRAKLGWFDRVLGAGFGLVRGVAVCSVVYLALTAFPVRLESVARARTGPALAEGARLLALCTSGDVRARFLTQYHHLFA
ncbi:MAG: rane protein required for colicin production [Acidobacteriota bacterium]|jgi:membrane protein required for colicin V production|nr:rane protein required for colicin production [Acidobacteriota bacterium]